MAVGTYALATRDALKTYLGVTTSTDDTLMDSCIDRATAQIERYLGRNIRSRTWNEWHYLFYDRVLRVKQSPVSSIVGVFGGWEHALTIQSTTTTDIQVSASINTEAIGSGNPGEEVPSMILTRMAVGGTVTTTTLSFATYTDCADLVTAISATSGFSATLARDMPTLNLRPMVGDCLISSLYIDGARTPIETAIDSANGLLRLEEGSSLSQSLLVRYVAGYATTPADIEQACLHVSARIFLARKADTSVTSESLGDYSYSRAAPDADRTLLAMLLADWREIR